MKGYFLAASGSLLLITDVSYKTQTYSKLRDSKLKKDAFENAFNHISTLCEIWSSHCGEDDSVVLLSFDTV
jgi:hypothetical protein